MKERHARTLLALSLLAGILVVGGLRTLEPPIPVDWADPSGWMAGIPPEDAVAALARIAGLAAGYWFLGSTVLYVLARLSRRALAIRVTALLTSPLVRRLADKAVAGALVTGLMAAPALAFERVPADYLPVELPTPVVSAAPEQRVAAEWAEVEVAPGDNLWRLSRRHLDELAREGLVAPYWLRVIDTNLPHLRSGDPDLIYPGEIIRLPPPD